MYFIDFLYFTGKCTGSFQMKCEYCKELFSISDFECHLCDLYDNNPFDDRNVVKQIKANNTLIAKLLQSSSIIDQDSLIVNNQPKPKEVKSKKKGGPYECTLCDRNFIYESGLTSHLAKHALECPVEPKLILKHVVKCLKCSLILSGDDIGIVTRHFIESHGYSVEPSGPNGPNGKDSKV